MRTEYISPHIGCYPSLGSVYLNRNGLRCFALKIAAPCGISGWNISVSLDKSVLNISFQWPAHFGDLDISRMQVEQEIRGDVFAEVVQNIGQADATLHVRQHLSWADTPISHFMYQVPFEIDEDTIVTNQIRETADSPLEALLCRMKAKVKLIPDSKKMRK